MFGSFYPGDPNGNVRRYCFILPGVHNQIFRLRSSSFFNLLCGGSLDILLESVPSKSRAYEEQRAA